MKFGLLLLLASFNAFAQSSVFHNGAVTSGNISGPGIASPAVSLEVRGVPDAGMTIFRTGTSNTTGESFLMMVGRDSNGTPQKTMSLSSSWVDNNSYNGFTVVRYNAPYLSRGVQYDEIQMRQFGGKGTTFHGTSEIDMPPSGVKTMFKGRTQFNAPIVLLHSQGMPAPIAGAAQIWMEDASRLKIRLQNGQVGTISIIWE